MSLNINSDSLVLSASTTSANGTLVKSINSGFIRVINGTSGIAYVKSSLTASPVAVATDMAVGPNSTVIFQKPLDHVFYAALLSTGTGPVVFTESGNPD